MEEAVYTQKNLEENRAIVSEAERILREAIVNGDKKAGEEKILGAVIALMQYEKRHVLRINRKLCLVVTHAGEMLSEAAFRKEVMGKSLETLASAIRTVRNLETPWGGYERDVIPVMGEGKSVEIAVTDIETGREELYSYQYIICRPTAEND